MLALQRPPHTRHAAAAAAAASRPTAAGGGGRRALSSDADGGEDANAVEGETTAQANTRRIREGRAAKAAAAAEARVQAMREAEAAKDAAYVEMREDIRFENQMTRMDLDVDVDGSRAHLQTDRVRNLMLRADEKMAYQHLPPRSVMPDLYQRKSWVSAERKLQRPPVEMVKSDKGESRKHMTRQQVQQKEDEANAISSDATAGQDLMLDSKHEEHLIRKYGFTLPYIVGIHRGVARKKIATGSRMKRKILVVAGNAEGIVGWGVGKSGDRFQAWLNAYSLCLENAVYVPRSERRTFPQPVVGKFKRTRVIMLPAPRNHGVTAGRQVSMMMNAAGVKDCICKIVGRRNPYTVTMAVFDGLRQMRSAQEMAESRGLKVHDFLDPGDYALVQPTADEMMRMHSKASEAIDRAMVLSAASRRFARREADEEEVSRLSTLSEEEMIAELEAEAMADVGPVDGGEDGGFGGVVEDGDADGGAAVHDGASK